MFFLYVFEVGSVATGGSLFLLKQTNKHQKDKGNILETLQQRFSSGNKVGGTKRNLTRGVQSGLSYDFSTMIILPVMYRNYLKLCGRLRSDCY